MDLRNILFTSDRFNSKILSAQPANNSFYDVDLSSISSPSFSCIFGEYPRSLCANHIEVWLCCMSPFFGGLCSIESGLPEIDIISFARSSMVVYLPLAML